MTFHVVLLRKDGTYNADQLGLSSFETWDEAEIAILKMCLSHEWFMQDPDRAAIVEKKSGQPYTLTFSPARGLSRREIDHKLYALLNPMSS